MMLWIHPRPTSFIASMLMNLDKFLSRYVINQIWIPKTRENVTKEGALDMP